MPEGVTALNGGWAMVNGATPGDRFAPLLEVPPSPRRLGSRQQPMQFLAPQARPEEAAGGRVEVVLSDNGGEFCGRPDRHPYELFLQLEEIEHRTTRVKRPQSNGIVERLHRTLLDEHFRVKGRRTWFETIEEMQTVLDDCMTVYNRKRPHQGRGMNGRTPWQAFQDGLPASVNGGVKMRHLGGVKIHHWRLGSLST